MLAETARRKGQAAVAAEFEARAARAARQAEALRRATDPPADDL